MGSSFRDAYTVTPELSGIDVYSLNPLDPLEPLIEDLDRVEYFFEDPVAAGASRPTRIHAAAEPFAFSFVAAYAGNGTDPRPFPIWARAVDTSTNESNVVLLELEVLPNQTPVDWRGHGRRGVPGCRCLLLRIHDSRDR